MTDPENLFSPAAVALLDEINEVLPPATGPDHYLCIDHGAVGILDRRIAALSDGLPAEVLKSIVVARDHAYNAAMKTDFPYSSKWMEDVI